MPLGFALLAGGIAALTCAGLAVAAWRYRALYRKAVEDTAYSSDLIEHLSEGIYRSSIDGRQLSANRALVRLNGYDSEAEMLEAVTDIGVEWYVKPGRRDEFREILHRDGVVEDFVSEIYRHKTRERIWISESARIVRHPLSGKPLHYEGSVREITETVKRLRLEEHFRKLMSHIPGGLFQISGNHAGEVRIEYLSEGFHRLAEIPLEQHYADGSLFQKFVHPEDREGYFNAFRGSYATLESLDHEFRIITPAGQEKWLRITAKPEADGGTMTWYGYVSDISLRKRQAIEIEKLAYYDPLTGLPNRRLLLERMAGAVKASGKSGRRGGLLFIDLDNFKALNDTQGHDVGDEYLVQVANRLRGCVGPEATVARMGGDEFVVILPELGEDDEVAAARASGVAEGILATLRIPFERGEIRHAASASVGLVIFDGSERRTDELLKRADIAMYQAKAAGRDGLALFDPHLMDGETERFTLTGELRRAVAEEALEIHFQPQVDRAGRVAGAEALLRWHHPVLGQIPPDTFIPVAEQAGMMNTLCRFVIGTGVATLAEWQREPATAKLRLAVNVSVRSFSAPDFVPFVKDLVETSGIDASRLTIEFTEHVMAKDQRLVARRMRDLKALGLRFSLDDFGTGYSSLARLKTLPFDEVKIDGGFVADIETSDSDRALVRTILAMATTMGLEAVAEHVETRNQEAFLHAFGCDLFQGWLYSPALPEDAFKAFVAERNDGAELAPLRRTA